jgi:hypothetical protein
MGNKLSCSCAPLIRKAYRYEDSPWQTSRRRDGHLLRSGVHTSTDNMLLNVPRTNKLNIHHHGVGSSTRATRHAMTELILCGSKDLINENTAVSRPLEQCAASYGTRGLVAMITNVKNCHFPQHSLRFMIFRLMDIIF